MADETSAAEGLIDRLLEDPGLRSSFRRDPAGVARAAGLDRTAEELEQAAGDAMVTLDARESRSSLAGALVAAAMEGFALAASPVASGAPHASAVPAARVAKVAPPVPDPASAAAPAPAAPAAPVAPAAAAPPVDSVDPAETDALVDPDGDGRTAGGNPVASWADGDGPDEDGEDEDEPDEEEPDEEEPDEEEPDEDEDDDSDDGEDDSDDDGGGSGLDAPDLRSGHHAGPDPGGGGVLDLSDVSRAYPGDDAPPRDVARWMARAAADRGLPPELPVMASLVESNLRNLNYGDADSVGFFQMRVGIWNTGEYSGYPERPELQLDWFLDHAEEVRKQRIAAGLPVNDPSSYGDWVADIERPAEQYRGRYQLRLQDARDLIGRVEEEVAGGGGGSGRTAGRAALAALAAAKSQLGVPYVWGGETAGRGFDCSGLVQWAYAKAGISIPRVTDQQILASNGTPVRRDHLLPGDLVFFRDSSGYVHHVGMSLGGDRFIQAPSRGGHVEYASLKDPYFASEYTGARRFAPPRQGGPGGSARLMRAIRVDGR